MSAEEAIIFFEQQPFNVVISDYQMPVITGGELIGILRCLEESEQRPKSTMLILTADNSKQCQAHCNEVGVDRILMKPLTLQTLADLISRLNSEQSALTSSVETVTDEHDAENLLFEADFLMTVVRLIVRLILRVFLILQHSPKLLAILAHKRSTTIYAGLNKA